MQIQEIAVNKLKPYPNNPRVNDHAVEAVKASIREFGFKVPIVVDRSMVIVTGHTRLKAAKQLKMKTVPCIVAEDLTDEQIKAFRLADNRVSEEATWDLGKLEKELQELSFSFDMGDFGFDLDTSNLSFTDGQNSRSSSNSTLDTGEDEDSRFEGDASEQTERLYYGDEREKTITLYRLYDYDPSRVAGMYQMPTLEATQHIPERLIGFNYMLTSDEYDAGIHFYLDDYQFERIWRRPALYLEKLSAFDCVLTPDFSLYMNMPLAMKVWNIYRSRLIGQMMQDYGITVIPTLSWAEPETFAFCFDGIESGGTVSVSTIGVKQDEKAKAIWNAGMDEAMKRLHPSAIVVYGGDIGYDFGSTRVVHIENEVTRRWKGGVKCGW